MTHYDVGRDIVGDNLSYKGFHMGTGIAEEWPTGSATTTLWTLTSLLQLLVSGSGS